MDHDIITPDAGEIFDIELDENILRKNRELATENGLRLVSHDIKSIDIMGSIGSGKTTLIEELVKYLRDKYTIFVLGGDITTTIDVDRVARHNVETLQINTGKECHLDANLIKKALNKINLGEIEVLFIENVGNLICPGEFPLGADMRIVVISVTEGPYMVLKHPYIFGTANIVVINKIDLADVMEVDPQKLKGDVFKINPNASVVFTNARKGIGVKQVASALGLE
ncbi:MAG: hydrogenase nickel incorporation protein HypB [Candidatus Kariarchaeaceae archaeon]|jgi:hydrogenase nickel incorporation protein HypB